MMIAKDWGFGGVYMCNLFAFVTPYPKELKLDDGPDAGMYDAHLTPFGADKKNRIIMGGKYKDEVNDNPPPGLYDADRAESITKYRNRSALIKQPTSPYRRPKESNPDPGKYDSHLKPFGSGLSKSVNMGSKYEFKPDSNPPVGGYDIDRGLKVTQFQNKSTIIKKDTSPYRRPKESLPDPGQYDKHLKPFGSDLKGVSMGSKDKFTPDDNPRIGQYDVDRGLAATSFQNRSTIIRKETSPYRRPKENNPDPG